MQIKSRNIIITTSNSVENKTIAEYVDVISAQIVIGTNIFSDFKASLTDFFGGHSGSYQNKLQAMLDEAKQVLTYKAQRLKADAIIGLKFDTSSISAKEMSMLMTVASGTAVRFTKEKKQEDNTSSDAISASYLALEVNRMQLEDKLNKQNLPDNEDWELLLEMPKSDYFEPLLQLYLKVFNSSSANATLFKENFSKYLNLIDSNQAIDPLYDTIEKINSWQPLAKLIQECKLFSPSHVLKFVQLGFQNVIIELLNADKQEYSKEDLVIMKELKSAIKEKLEPKFAKDPTRLKVIMEFYYKVDILDKLLAEESISE